MPARRASEQVRCGGGVWEGSGARGGSPWQHFGEERQGGEGASCSVAIRHLALLVCINSVGGTTQQDRAGRDERAGRPAGGQICLRAVPATASAGGPACLHGQPAACWQCLHRDFVDLLALQLQQCCGRAHSIPCILCGCCSLPPLPRGIQRLSSGSGALRFVPPISLSPHSFFFQSSLTAPPMPGPASASFVSPRAVSTVRPTTPARTGTWMPRGT